MLVRLLCAVAAGLVLSLAFEPVALPWLIPFAVAAFVLATRGLRLRRAFVARARVRRGVLLHPHRTGCARSASRAWLALSALETLFYALLGSLSAVLQRHRLWPLWFAAAWTTIEVVAQRLAVQRDAVGPARVRASSTPRCARRCRTSARSASASCSLCSGALLAWRRRSVRGSGAAGPPRWRWSAWCALLAVPGRWSPWEARRPTRAITVAAVQGDVPGHGRRHPLRLPAGHPEPRRRHRRPRRATWRRGEAPQPDFVLWPENSTAVDPFDDAETNAGIRAASAAIGVPILVGAIVDAGPDHVLNQGIVWDPVTGAGDRYTKRHPVPFGEYIPFRRFFDGYSIFGRLARGRPRHAERHPAASRSTIGGVAGGRRDLLRRRLRRRDLRPAVATAPSCWSCRPATRRSSTPTRSTSSSRSPGCARSRPGAGSRSRRPTASRASSPPTARWSPRAEPRTQAVLVEQVGLIDALTPAMRIGPWSGRLAARAHGPGRPAVPGPVSSAARAATRTARARARPDAADDARTSGGGRSDDRTARPRRDGRARPTTRPTTSPGSSAGCAPPSPTSTCSSSTTTHPTAPGRSPTSWPPPTPPSTCCTGPPRAASARRTSPGSAWALDAGYDVIGEMDADGSHQPEQLHRLLDGAAPTPTW